MKNKIGRPASKNPKGISKTIRLTVDEWADVVRFAKRNQMSTSEFIRHCVRVGVAKIRRIVEKEKRCKGQ